MELFRQGGAKVECGGERVVLVGECAGGWYISKDGMRFIKEEIFGSVAAFLFMFDSERGMCDR